MGITGVLSNAFGAVKAKGLGAARVAARNMGDAGRRMVGEAAQGKSTTMMAGGMDNLAGNIGKYKDEVLAGGRGVMRNATTGNTTSSAANLNLGDKILGGGGGVMRGAANSGRKFGDNLPATVGRAARGATNSNVPARQIAQNFTPGRTASNIDWQNAARGMTRVEKAGLTGAGIGAAMTTAGTRARGRR